MKGNKNSHIKYLYEKARGKELPINFIRSITGEEVFSYYTKSTLIFPSHVKTFGLPLLEARLHNSIILASGCAFSREILDGYNRAVFFDPFDLNSIKEAMKKQILVSNRI